MLQCEVFGDHRDRGFVPPYRLALHESSQGRLWRILRKVLSGSGWARGTAVTAKMLPRFMFFLCLMEQKAQIYTGKSNYCIRGLVETLFSWGGNRKPKQFYKRIKPWLKPFQKIKFQAQVFHWKILSNIYEGNNANPSQSLSENRRRRNTFMLILEGQHCTYSKT